MTEYPDKYTPEEITRRMNETIDTMGNADDAFVQQAAYNVLEQSEW